MAAHPPQTERSWSTYTGSTDCRPAAVRRERIGGQARQMHRTQQIVGAFARLRNPSRNCNRVALFFIFDDVVDVSSRVGKLTSKKGHQVPRERLPRCGVRHQRQLQGLHPLRGRRRTMTMVLHLTSSGYRMSAFSFSTVLAH